jgi:hypothetical protein
MILRARDRSGTLPWNSPFLREGTAPPAGIADNIDLPLGISAVPRELCSVHFPLPPGGSHGSPGFLLPHAGVIRSLDPFLDTIETV